MKKCRSCFQHEIVSFKDESDFTHFKVELDKKVEKSLMKFIEYVRPYFGKPRFIVLGLEFGGVELDGYYKYQCNQCLSFWQLLMPENAQRGYFKILKESQNPYPLP